MPKGGHARSGPAKVEGSRTSERAGYILSALPPTGYDGDIPDFPLPRRSVYYFVGQGKDRERVYDADATELLTERELEVWSQVWATPQACAWSSEQWRHGVVAMYVRTFVICEGSEATAADKNSLHRFADDIGMSVAGLKLNGWKIADLKVEKPAQTLPDPTEDEDDPRNRLSVVRNAVGG